MRKFLAVFLVVAVAFSLQAGTTKVSVPDFYDDSGRLDPSTWAESNLYRGQDLARFEPPKGYVYTGVDADQQRGDTLEVATQKWEEWTELMGGTPAFISHTFEGFDVGFGYDFSVAEERGAVPLITWQTSSTSPRTIAHAGETSGGRPTDEVILRNAYLSGRYGKPVFLRVDQEMNAHWFPWCAYNEDGSRRSFSPKDFRDMWRRMVIIFRGGKVAEMNRRLAEVGLPPLDPDVQMPSWMGLPPTSEPDSYFKPAKNVAFVFNPADAPGVPNVVGNRWVNYYPGNSYVDWVGQTTYDLTWNATIDQRFRWLESFYEKFSVGRGKPYMMGEWGVAPEASSGLGDDPDYIRRVLAWQSSHPKVKALVYFSVRMDKAGSVETGKGDFRLSSYPDSAEVLAAAVKQPQFLNGR
jgi:hypothetical protein